MSEKLRARLRKHKMECKNFLVGLRTLDGWLGDKYQVKMPTNDGKEIFQLGQFVLSNLWKGEGIFQVQITALNPQPLGLQLDLFETHDEVKAQVNAVMDKINDKYGEFTLAPGRLINRSDMPNVISPAWKPYGHRQTI